MDTATSVDGRTARRLENRERILDAALSLVEDGADVNADSIARRAGLSARSVYNHFPSARDLVAGMYERGTDRVMPLLRGMPSPDDPFEERVRRWSEVRARVHEAIAAMRWRALQAEERYPDLQPELGSLRRLHEEDVQTMFPELDPTAQEAVVALTDALGWRALRRHQGLSVAEARAVVEDTIRRLAR